MGPDSLGAELTAAAVAVVAAILVGLLWDATGDRRRIPLRIAALTLSVLAVAATAGIWVNRQTETYPTWSSLGAGPVEQDGPQEPGAEPPPEPPAPVAPTGPPPPVSPATGPVATGPTASGAVSRIARISIAGSASGLTLPAYVYLPPGYDSPGQRRTRFPVIEALHGFPGSPRTWLNRLEVRSRLDQEITAGRMAPTVVVFPYQTPDALLDTECVNLAKGPQVETFLTVDLPAVVRAGFRVRADRAGWGLIGYSAGGFCAANLLLRNPDSYAAAASLSGYAGPEITIGDGSEKTVNNIAWRLANLRQPPVSLYLACARADRHALRDTTLIASLARPPLSVATGILAHGGHNAAAWRAMQAPAFDWLSARLARPESTGPA
jgi:poly(3-hydroxybutyrate) depolymerase